MYAISSSSCSSVTSPWNVGMIGWKPATTFALGLQNRLAEVGLVGDDRLAALRA